MADIFNLAQSNHSKFLPKSVPVSELQQIFGMKIVKISEQERLQNISGMIGRAIVIDVHGAKQSSPTQVASPDENSKFMALVKENNNVVLSNVSLMDLNSATRSLDSIDRDIEAGYYEGKKVFGFNGSDRTSSISEYASWLKQRIVSLSQFGGMTIDPQTFDSKSISSRGSDSNQIYNFDASLVAKSIQKNESSALSQKAAFAYEQSQRLLSGE